MREERTVSCSRCKYGYPGTGMQKEYYFCQKKGTDWYNEPHEASFHCQYAEEGDYLQTGIPRLIRIIFLILAVVVIGVIVVKSVWGISQTRGVDWIPILVVFACVALLFIIYMKRRRK